eukprot:m.235320 g.235320  ORF g.235320 m.235320 type:complete len:2309 (+) comp22479_c0_seq2:890-7816(+)
MRQRFCMSPDPSSASLCNAHQTKSACEGQVLSNGQCTFRDEVACATQCSNFTTSTLCGNYPQCMWFPCVLSQCSQYNNVTHPDYSCSSTAPTNTMDVALCDSLLQAPGCHYHWNENQCVQDHWRDAQGNGGPNYCISSCSDRCQNDQSCLNAFTAAISYLYNNIIQSHHCNSTCRAMFAPSTTPSSVFYEDAMQCFTSCDCSPMDVCPAVLQACITTGSNQDPTSCIYALECQLACKGTVNETEQVLCFAGCVSQLSPLSAAVITALDRCQGYQCQRDGCKVPSGLSSSEQPGPGSYVQCTFLDVMQGVQPYDLQIWAGVTVSNTPKEHTLYNCVVVGGTLALVDPTNNNTRFAPINSGPYFLSYTRAGPTFLDDVTGFIGATVWVNASGLLQQCDNMCPFSAGNPGNPCNSLACQDVSNSSIPFECLHYAYLYCQAHPDDFGCLELGLLYCPFWFVEGSPCVNASCTAAWTSSTCQAAVAAYCSESPADPGCSPWQCPLEGLTVVSGQHQCGYNSSVFDVQLANNTTLQPGMVAFCSFWMLGSEDQTWSCATTNSCNVSGTVRTNSVECTLPYFPETAQRSDFRVTVTVHYSNATLPNSPFCSSERGVGPLYAGSFATFSPLCQTTHVVLMTGSNIFEYRHVYAAVGDRVLFVNADSTTHSVTSLMPNQNCGKMFESGDLAPQSVYELPLTAALTVPYVDRHGSGFRGELHVSPASAGCPLGMSPINRCAEERGTYDPCNLFVAVDASNKSVAENQCSATAPHCTFQVFFQCASAQNPLAPSPCSAYSTSSSCASASEPGGCVWQNVLRCYTDCRTMNQSTCALHEQCSFYHCGFDNCDQFSNRSQPDYGCAIAAQSGLAQALCDQAMVARGCHSHPLSAESSVCVMDHWRESSGSNGCEQCLNNCNSDAVCVNATNAMVEYATITLSAVFNCNDSCVNGFAPATPQTSRDNYLRAAECMRGCSCSPDAACPVTFQACTGSFSDETTCLYALGCSSQCDGNASCTDVCFNHTTASALAVGKSVLSCTGHRCHSPTCQPVQDLENRYVECAFLPTMDSVPQVALETWVGQTLMPSDVFHSFYCFVSGGVLYDSTGTRMAPAQAGPLFFGAVRAAPNDSFPVLFHVSDDIWVNNQHQPEACSYGGPGGSGGGCPFWSNVTSSPCLNPACTQQSNNNNGPSPNCSAAVFAYCLNYSDPACSQFIGGGGCPFEGGVDSPCANADCISNHSSLECYEFVNAYCQSHNDSQCIADCPFLHHVPQSPCFHTDCTQEFGSGAACVSIVDTYCALYPTEDYCLCPYHDFVSPDNPCIAAACAPLSGGLVNQANASCAATVAAYCSTHTSLTACCPLGSESTGSACVACADGYYRNDTLMTACQPCPPNTFSNSSVGTQQCVDWAVCTAGLEQSVPPTATYDRECRDIDGCQSQPCSYFAATCTDVAAPGTGYTCTGCVAGYVGDGYECTNSDVVQLRNLACFCPPEDGWYKTQCSDMDSRPCRVGSGTETRMCSSLGQWETSDTSMCFSPSNNADPCLQQPCSPNSRGCTSSGNTRVCGTCRLGYTGDGEVCVDVALRDQVLEQEDQPAVLQTVYERTLQTLTVDDVANAAQLIANVAEGSLARVNSSDLFWLGGAVSNILSSEIDLVAAQANVSLPLARSVPLLTMEVARALEPNTSIHHAFPAFTFSLYSLRRSEYRGLRWPFSEVPGPFYQENSYFAEVALAPNNAEYRNETVDFPPLGLWELPLASPNETAAFQVLMYKTSAWLTTQKRAADSRVLSVEVDGVPSGFVLGSDQMLRLVFAVANLSSQTKARCVFWDFDSGDWSGEGVSVERVESGAVHCRSTHMTNFAVLVDVSGSQNSLSESDRFHLALITYVGLGLSVTCMCMVIFVLSMFKQLRTTSKSIVLNLCIWLTAAQVVFLGGITLTDDTFSCQLVTVLLHYALLASFMWMLVDGHHLYKTFVVVFSSGTIPWRTYIAAAYLIPAVIVAVTAFVRWDDYGKGDYCWLPQEHGTIYAFVGPMVAIVVVNIAIYVLIMRNIFNVEARVTSKFSSVSSGKGKERRQIQKFRLGLKSTASFFSLLGITWALGLFAVRDASTAFQYIFAILNSLQGVLIFVFHVAIDPKCRAAVRDWVTRSSSRGSRYSGSGPRMVALASELHSTENKSRGLSTNESNPADKKSRSEVTAASGRVIRPHTWMHEESPPIAVVPQRPKSESFDRSLSQLSGDSGTPLLAFQANNVSQMLQMVDTEDEESSGIEMSSLIRVQEEDESEDPGPDAVSNVRRSSVAVEEGELYLSVMASNPGADGDDSNSRHE